MALRFVAHPAALGYRQASRSYRQLPFLSDSLLAELQTYLEAAWHLGRYRPMPPPVDPSTGPETAATSDTNMDVRAMQAGRTTKLSTRRARLRALVASVVADAVQLIVAHLNLPTQVPGTTLCPAPTQDLNPETPAPEVPPAPSAAEANAAPPEPEVTPAANQEIAQLRSRIAQLENAIERNQAQVELEIQTAALATRHAELHRDTIAHNLNGERANLTRELQVGLPPATQSIKPPSVAHFDDHSVRSKRNAEAFLKDMQSWFNHSGVQDMRARLEFFSMSLGGEVRTGWDSYIVRWCTEQNLAHNCTPLITWDTLCDSFRECVGQPANKQHEALARVLSGEIRQQRSQTVVQYYTAFKAQLAYCSHLLLPPAQAMQFVKGLIEPLRKQCAFDPVTNKPYLSVIDVFNRAVALEEAHYSFTSASASVGATPAQNSRSNKRGAAGPSAAAPAAKKSAKPSGSRDPDQILTCDFCKTWTGPAHTLRAHLAQCAVRAAKFGPYQPPADKGGRGGGAGGAGGVGAAERPAGRGRGK